MSAAAILASVDPRPAPERCATMAEVRQGVDALDRALVTLLAERQRYMDAAARIKQDRGAVRDTARIEVPEADLAEVVARRDAVRSAVHDAGYRYVTLDLDGFRSGNLNKALGGSGRRTTEEAS